jgi:demethylmenaquinone methyltransferase/2-methoxy-6-polyprenyl-1,4-benzoquinol methylase
MEEAAMAQQLDYYRARAGEYDDWWFRTGRYDHGDDANAAWFEEVAELEAALERFDPRGNVLELACGTGLWTRHLVGVAEHVTAVDGAAEVLARNRARIAELGASESVSYVQADLFGWEPPRHAFDACVFAFWLSHVPEHRFDAFWEMVATALRPGGRVLLIDSARSERSKARDHTMPAEGSDTERRRLDDGREFEIIKRYYEPAALRKRLAPLGWDCEPHSTGEFFIYATARPSRERR